MERTEKTDGWIGRLRTAAARLAAAPTGRNALLTVGGGFGVQLALLISGILVARLLGVEDRGQLALFWVVALVMAFVGTTGLNSSITYWVAREPRRSRALGRLMLRVGVVQIAIAMAAQAGILAIAVHGADHEVRVAAAISLAVLPSMVAVFYGMAFLQGFERFKGWTAIRLMPAVLYTVAVIALALADSATLVAVTSVWVASYAITAVAAINRARAALRAQEGDEPAPRLGELQRFGAKAFLGGASPSDTLQLDQLLVGLFLSASDLGLYVVGLSFTNLPRILAQSVGFVVYPHVARRPDRRQARRAMWRAAALTAVIVGAIVAVLEASAGWLVPLFFGDAFSGAVELTRILLVAAALVSVRRVLGDGARGAGYPGLGSVAEVASTVVLLPAMAVLAGTAGVTGVAWALVIAAAVGLTVLLAGLAIDSPRLGRNSIGVKISPEPSAPLHEGPS